MIRVYSSIRKYARKLFIWIKFVWKIKENYIQLYHSRKRYKGDDMNSINKKFPIKEITVYPNAARIRRIQHIPLKKGDNELIISGLPAMITEESVRIETGGSRGVKICEIFARDRFIEQVSENRYRKEMKKCEALILAQNKLEAQFRNYTDEFLLFLNKENLSAVPFNDRVRTIVVKNWDEFFLFVRKTLTENRNSARELLFRWIDLQKQIEAAGKNLEDLRSYEKIKEHEIVAMLEAGKDLEEEIHVLYLQPGVTWHPAYTLRAELTARRISINLFGMISQKTGEDWENIKLVLSTAIPMENLDIPEVKSKRIKEQDTSIIMTQPAMTSEEEADGLFDECEKVEIEDMTAVKEKMDTMKPERKEERKRRSKVSIAKKKVSGKKGYGLASGIAQDKQFVGGLEIPPPDVKNAPSLSTDADDQIFFKKTKEVSRGGLQRINDLVKAVDKKVLPPFSLSTLSDYYTALYNHLKDTFTPEESVPVSKRIKTNKFFTKGIPLMQSVGGFDYRYKVSSIQKIIPSSAVPVQVSVDMKELPVELVYITVPLEKELVYLKAVFSNEYENPFPAGPAQVFVENNFLGNINFPTLGINEGTSISLGVEQDIKVLRKEKKFRKTSGVVKKGVTVDYSIEIELVSYKPERIVIEVLDRIPLCSNKAEIDITGVTYNPKPELVTDRNIIRWRINLESGKKKVLRFSYSIKHPEDFRLTMQRGNHPFLEK
jgi:hypothetical protein